ncbi:MAG TPA: fumarylacetoacetase [Acidobacteriaceae bacterium]|nr:fumarylacetoacetase [Acidobacteriaceae bacterium]
MSIGKKSWIESANGFGLNHLPYGAFRASGSTHLCVRIGDFILDLAACAADGLCDSLPSEVRKSLTQPTLNSLLALGPQTWQAIRRWLTSVLGEDASSSTKGSIDRFLHPVGEVELALPIAIGNYTDFYASVDHARRVGEIFRPGNPLLPNYKHIPIGYHGRASSIVISGTEIRRPWGQSRPPKESAAPNFAPSAALDYEVELALIVGQGNALGEPIPITEVGGHLFGVALLNDWSARDVQSWEYQPLGPFLGKSFATSISPWITPLAALAPFRVPALARPAGDPSPLRYLHNDADRQSGAFDIRITASLTTEASRAAGTAPMTLSTANSRYLYWTPAQLVAHHTSNGCNLQPGDVLASGTISGPERDSAGCLLELTRNGAEPLQLPNGEHRSWLEDGDQVTLTAFCEREGSQPLQLGSCTGRIIHAHTAP